MYRLGWRLLYLVVVCGFISSCAVFDKDMTAGDSFFSPPSGDPISLAYSSEGRGKPVLLLHGFGASRYSWRYITQTLAKRYRVISIDLKGFGTSPKPRDARYSVYEQAHLVSHFIQQQQLSQLTLIGHSFGGGVALASAVYLQKTSPGILKKLVLIDSMAYPQKLPFFIAALATPVLGTSVVNILPNSLQVSLLLHKVYFDDALISWQSIQEYADNLALKNAKYALVKTARQLLPVDLMQFSEHFSRLEVDALVIHSKEDEIVPLWVAKKIHRALPRSQLRIIENVGHAVQEEQPGLLLDILAGFLNY